VSRHNLDIHRRVSRSLVCVAILSCALTLSGCVTQEVLPYHASIANQMTLARLPHTSRLRVTTGTDPADIQTSVRAVRFAAPGDGSWSSYLNEALRTELSTSGNYDAGANAMLEATLVEVQVVDGKAEVAARFVVKRDQTVRYDKLVRVSTQWDSQFIGVLAASDGLNQATAIFQALLHKLFEDPDFVGAA
jgi:hypothetical protein